MFFPASEECTGGMKQSHGARRAHSLFSFSLKPSGFVGMIEWDASASTHIRGSCDLLATNDVEIGQIVVVVQWRELEQGAEGSPILPDLAGFKSVTESRHWFLTSSVKARRIWLE